MLKKRNTLSSDLHKINYISKLIDLDFKSRQTTLSVYCHWLVFPKTPVRVCYRPNSFRRLSARILSGLFETKKPAVRRDRAVRTFGVLVRRRLKDISMAVPRYISDLVFSDGINSTLGRGCSNWGPRRTVRPIWVSVTFSKTLEYCKLNRASKLINSKRIWSMKNIHC